MTIRRIAALSALVLSLTSWGLLSAGSASAHVTVAAPGVTVGASDAAITFRVPDESDSASTVGLKVQLPADHPIAGVLVAPQPGWTASIIQTRLATPLHTDDGEISQVVSQIDWQAQPGAGIKPGFFGQFTIIAGKLPDDANTLTFKVVQTYNDKSTVAWIEQPAPGSKVEPEHPAPTLQLATASTTAVPADNSARSAGSSKPASQATAVTGIVLGGVGLVLGAAALIIALTGRRANVPR